MNCERYHVEQEMFECRCCGYFWITDLDPETAPTFVFDSANAGEEDRQRQRAEEVATKIRNGVIDYMSET